MTLGELDQYLIGEGAHMRLWDVLGAHPRDEGTDFAVWAPNAAAVSVVGDFNIWDGRRHPMRRVGVTGVWEIFLPGLGEARGVGLDGRPESFDRGLGLTGPGLAWQIVQEWLKTPWGGERHARRVDMISDIEHSYAGRAP